jgi:putative ABC transport system permease protein
MRKLVTSAPVQGAGFGRLAAIALRDLRGGVKRLMVLVMSVALGVGAITAVGALMDALEAGFDRQGRMLVGGDIVVSRIHERLDPFIRDWLVARGEVSEAATLRSMVRNPKGGAGRAQALVEPARRRRSAAARAARTSDRRSADARDARDRDRGDAGL